MKLSEAIQNDYSNSLFQHFKKEMFEGNETMLNYMYFDFRSSEKTASSSVLKFSENGIISDEKLDILCNMLYLKYGNSWERLYTLLSIQYNPIENYSMTEEESRDAVDNYEETQYGKINEYEKQGQEQYKKEGSEIDVKNGIEENENKIAGYNSEIYTNDSMNTTSYNDLEDRMSYDNRVDTTDYVNRKDISSDKGIDKKLINEKRKLTRKGNIGVTTSQQMAESEIELWKWNFYNTVFENIDNELTISTYESD